MAAMDCQICEKKPATVHVIEVLEVPKSASEPYKRRDKHVCEGCAAVMDLPHAQVAKKNVLDIWKLLPQSAQRPVQEGGLCCPDTGSDSDSASAAPRHRDRCQPDAVPINDHPGRCDPARRVE